MSSLCRLKHQRRPQHLGGFLCPRYQIPQRVCHLVQKILGYHLEHHLTPSNPVSARLRNRPFRFLRLRLKLLQVFDPDHLDTDHLIVQKFRLVLLHRYGGHHPMSR